MTPPTKIVILRPLPVTRLMNLAPAVLLFFFSLILVQDVNFEGGLAALLIAGAAVGGVLLGVRAWRYSIILTPDRIIVRGYLWSRTVRRDRVIAVTDFAWLIWKDAEGRARRTPLTVLWIVGPVLERYQAHAALCHQRAQMWAR